MGDPRAWAVWVATVLVAASYSRNPLHGIVLLLVTLWVRARVTERRRAGGTGVPLRLTLIVIPLAAGLNALSSHVGETVLLWLPSWLPLVGGAVTLEALVFGTINGLSLVTLLVGFAAFNHAMSVRDLMRLVPRAFHELGVVASISLTFVPQTLQSIERIREAQAVRGHRLKGLRDWLPVVTPLLIGALERGFTLAESMMARGYASVAASAATLVRVLISAGLLVALGGWLAVLLLPSASLIGWGVMAFGVVLLAGALWLTGRSRHHTTYHRSRWRLGDTVTVLGCVPILVLLAARRDLLYYSPYPRIDLPTFDLAVGVSVLGLLLPGLMSAPSSEQDRDDPH